MIPVVRELGAGLGGDGGPGDVLWWALALGACLGGNLTIVAASANVLVADLAERGGQRIRFWEFFRYGSLVTLPVDGGGQRLPLAALPPLNGCGVTCPHM